jgi:hypothetical protein
MARTLVQQLVQAAHIQVALLSRGGLSPWSWRNRLILAPIAPLTIVLIAGFFAGARGTFAVVGSGLLGRLFHELITCSTLALCASKITLCRRIIVGTAIERSPTPCTTICRVTPIDMEIISRAHRSVWTALKLKELLTSSDEARELSDKCRTCSEGVIDVEMLRERTLADITRS